MPPDLGFTRPLAQPIYLSAVYALPDLDVLDRVIDQGEPGFIYARDGHPNAAALATELTRLEAAAWTSVCGSGMGALTTALLANLASGDRVVASNRLYGRTAQFLRSELSRFGVTTEFVDTGDLDKVRHALRTPARFVVAETISNPLLRVADIPALAQLAHAVGALLLVDNTFATPVQYRPLESGADLVMESLTKLGCGHSDVTLGSLSGSDPKLQAKIEQTRSVWGFFPSPFDCWLLQRSLETLHLRVRAATANAAALAEWLRELPGVAAVCYPGLDDHPDHQLAMGMFGGSFGNMLGLELDGGKRAVNRFMQAGGVPFTPSLGHIATTCSYPALTSHRYESVADKRQMGIGDGLIRLSVGIEPQEAIRAALELSLR